MLKYLDIMQPKHTGTCRLTMTNLWTVHTQDYFRKHYH